MFKSVFAATAALSMSAGAALAGPYVNVEANAGWTGDDYTGATTDIHVGYEGNVWVKQDTTSKQVLRSLLEMVLKLRLSSLVKQVLAFLLPMLSGAYGEVSFITGEDDNGYGGKLGVKYNF